MQICVTKFIIIQKFQQVCKNCESKNANHAIEHNLLPIWYDNNQQPHYELPSKLCDMYDAEKC